MHSHATQRSLLGASALVVALGTTSTAQQKQLPPALGTPKAFTLPPKRDIVLPNGMKVTFVPFGTVPKVAVFASVQTGHIDEGSNEVSLSEIVGDMMREGTTSHSAVKIAEDVAGMGGELTVNVGDDVTRVGGTVLAERGAGMVALVGELLRQPLFPESELARITANKARDVAIAKSQPQALAQEQFARTLYGDHPYGRIFPSEAMLKGYTISQVKAFHALNFGAARTHLYVIGVFDAPSVEKAEHAAFDSWPAGRAATVNPPTSHATRSVALLDRPNAVQSTIMLGLPVAAPAAKDYTALAVTDALLGGTFGSRITTNIREEKGYTYSPYSYLDTHRGGANWIQQADVTTKFTGASLKEIFGEIARLQSDAPGTKELDGIKNNMIGLFTLRNGSRGGIVNQLERANLLGLGDDYLSGYVQRVMAVTPDEVRSMTAKYLLPDRMTLVVVGDKATVAPQLAPYERPVP